jgi:hypothetical protein
LNQNFSSSFKTLPITVPRHSGPSPVSVRFSDVTAYETFRADIFSQPRINKCGADAGMPCNLLKSRRLMPVFRLCALIIFPGGRRHVRMLCEMP